MTALSVRHLLPVGLVISLGTACASQRTGESAPATSGRALTAEDIERNPGVPLERLLEERFPGIEVTRGRDGNLSIRIRGATSVNSSVEPLYVIDGVPAVSGPTGGFAGINPHEIASIEVLKDPGTTAMYGVRGANGVIIVKTKRSTPQQS